MSAAKRLFAPGALLRWVLRLLVAAALLTLVVRTALPETEPGIALAIISAWRTGLFPAACWFAVSFGLFGVSFAIGASRFSMLLSAAGLRVGWGTVFRAYLVAGFFNLVLPGAILGDVYRLWDVRKQAGEGSRALGIIAVERLLGFSALGCLGLVAAPFVPLAAEDRHFAVILMAICALFAGVAGFALHPTANTWMRKLAAPIGRVSPRGARAIDGALAAILDLARSPKILGRAFVLSLLNQGLPVAAVYCLAVPLAGDTAWYWFAIIVPFVTLVSLVPISIGGTGVREYLYVALFGAVGMSSEVALALSLSLLGTALLWAGVGFAIFNFDRRRDRATVETAAP